MDISNEWEISERVFKKYLRDQERAGEYFVDGGMYASLSVHLVKVVLAFRYSSEDEHGMQKVNDHNGPSEDMDDDHMPSPANKSEALEFAILSLPFYLSNADYNSKLVELSRSMLNQKMKEQLHELHEDIDIEHEKIEQLCEAIDLYLKKEPLTPNEPRPNESQAVAKRFRAGKRIGKAMSVLKRVIHRH
ncbi:hypothetical protein GALMADRAFT_1252766 [Galerina marginata CBS 339.88]|uniref:Uncharacterized protein n=1 Tax=Galerina marginata (strain CBS 339.88) TaxID=685588 RepID=A0A067THR2_GALM3|nr:hypothetical protein GALMADRAFT_1252766 [Galerina marginata CBS 339.88]